MGVVTRLALAELRRRPGRLVVTSLAVVASAAVVVWVVSGYDALIEKIGEVGEEYLGRYDGAVSAPALDPQLLEALRADPDLSELEPVRQVRIVVEGPAGVSPEGPVADEPPTDDAYGGEGAYIDGDDSAGGGRHVHERPPVLVATNADAPPRALLEGSWLVAEDGVVLTHDLAERVGAPLGTPIAIRLGQAEARLTVVGLASELLAASVTGETVATASGAVQRSRGAGPAGEAVYVRPAVLARLSGEPDAPANLACLALRPGADLAAFAARWTPRLSALDPPARLVTTDDVREALQQSATTNAARTQSWAATAVSLLAALFIIFSTLSMGVTERMRQLALLRAVAFTRGQVARLIAVEALVLALVGWLGGLLAGWGLLAVAAWSQPELFGRGAGPGPMAVVLSGVCAVLGALAAAVGPAWTASRVDVVAALGARPRLPGQRWLGLATLMGLVLVGLSPLLLLGLPLPDEPRMLLFGLVGCPALGIGFLLLCPGLIVGVERLAGPLLARLLGLPAGLLRAQLASNLARTVGTTAALTVGLGLFVTIQVWGRSMLGPFLPGEWAPDALVSVATCLPDNELQPIAALPEVARVLPLAIEQPKLADDVTGAREKGESVVRQESVIIIGCEPEAALGGSDPLFDLTFVAGTRARAIELLRAGRHVIVPDHFVRTSGIGLGQTFRVLPPGSPTAPLEYTIAGVVSLPGWHFVSKEAGLRRRFPRAAALMFTDLQGLQQDFTIAPGRVDLLGFELRPGADEAALRAGLRPIAANYVSPRAAQGGLSIMTPAAIRSSLQARTAAILWGISQLPLITLLVTSLGVVNAIVASVRARRWELGVLRAIGVTRSGLVRMVLAEAVLVGLVACLLSLGFGFSAAWSGVTVAQFVSFFGGLAPPMVIPWSYLLAGVGGTLALCLLAGLLPAIGVGRADTLELLQEGRSAA